MKTNLLCLLALLLLLSCKKNNPKPEVHCYPQTYVHPTGGTFFGTPYRFVYNEQMQLIGLEEGSSHELKTRFAYNENGTLRQSEDLDYFKKTFRTVLYSYDAKEHLNRADTYLGVPGEKGLYSYHLFTYDADNRLTKIEHYLTGSSGDEFNLRTITYTYLSDHEMKASYKDASFGYSTIEWEALLTFDNQKSPYWSVPGYRTMLLVYDPSFSFKNNIIRYKKLPEESYIRQNYTSTFDYSPDGFPTTEYRYVGGYYTYHHVYTYTCK